MKTYVINLPRCRDRKEHILAECGRFELDAEIFPGIDGKELSTSDLRQLLFEPDRNSLTPPEVGCALSHLGIYRDMIEKDIPHALILEDDSVFKMDPRPLLAELARLQADAPDVYLLTHRSNQYVANSRRQIGEACFYRGWNGVGANGYVITRGAAANLLRFQTPLRCICDWWKYFQTNGLLAFYVPEEEFIGLHPELGDESNSLLEESRLTRNMQTKRLHYRRLQRQIAFVCKVKHFFAKMRYRTKLKYQ